MDYRLLEKGIFDDIAKGDWKNAIEKAHFVPVNHDIWQRMPSAKPMPADAVHKVLDVLGDKHSPHNANLASFLFELSNHLPGNLDSDTLNRIGENTENDQYVVTNVLGHPNFKYNERNSALSQAANWWEGYEKSVQPHHFATVKSMFTGKPEVLTDHRGNTGSSEPYVGLIPHLKDHATIIQKKVASDKEIPRRMIKGKPYIQVYRGVNGHYGQLIRDRAKYNSKTNEIDKKTFVVPTGHLTSWTTSPEIARQFAWNREIKGQPSDQGVVMSQWVPVDKILHSGFHESVFGQKFAHPREQELIVAHPEGKYKISTSNMEMQTPGHHGITLYPNIRKSESDYGELVDMTVDLQDSEDVLLFKNVKKIVPAITVLAFLGGSHDAKDLIPAHTYQQETMQAKAPAVSTITSMPSVIHQDLNPIGMIESTQGANVDHKRVMSGVNTGTKAYGSYGLMPLTIMETIEKNPALSSKYPQFGGLDYQKDEPKIHQLMKELPQAEIDIANSHWKRLKDTFSGDKDKMAHAWYNGITGTLRSSDEEIKSHEYVQKYNKYTKMLNLERKKHKLHKSENPMEDVVGVEKFVPFTEVQQNGRYIQDINRAIRSGQLHNLSNAGEFTHESFVAGFDPENSWLIKLEPFGKRSEVESAKYGLQVIKETAFYYIANRVFNLGDYTPKAILGETVKDGASIPSVAIKMYPQVFVSAVEMDKHNTDVMKSMLEKYRKDGTLHKLAAMLFILGDADCHGNNVLTDGTGLKLIDHGTSFADMKFNPAKDENIFVPFFMRFWGYKDNMSDDEKLKSLPEIGSEEVEKNVKHWLQLLSVDDLMKISENFQIDPRPSLMRLKLLQKLSDKIPIDKAINFAWTKRLEEADEAH